MKIILIGACGRMGKTVAAQCGSSDEIVCGVDLNPSPMAFPVVSSLENVNAAADVVIDFSSASGLSERLEYCISKKLPVLLAATGYTESDFALIRKATQKIAVFQTGNLSLGINLLQLLVKKAAAILGDDFDCEIVERHHNKKKDAPSGTALMLARSAEEGFGESKEFLYGRQGIVGERKKSEIGIHAVRGGTIVGEHEVSFAGEDEIVTLSHSARSRSVFAVGALKAAAWLIGRKAGLYNMQDYFGEL